MPSPSPTLPDPLPPEPFGILTRWLDEATRLRAQPNPNSMTLATIGLDGFPSARIVLCKQIDTAAGCLVFFTNYLGRKGRELDADERAEAVFHWDHQARQARVDGLVARTSAEESDAYFRSRPWISRVAAWASAQSEPITGRSELLEKWNAACRRFGIDPAKPPAPDADPETPRPPHWGGYRLYARRIELWIASEGRLHDRAEWARALQPRQGGGPGGSNGFAPASPWRATRLQP